MRRESNAEQNPAAGLEPAVIPSAPWRVTHVEALPGYRLKVAFRDGVTGFVDMSNLIHSPRAGVFAALSDLTLFAQAVLEYGAVTWPGELDLSPDRMHAEIREHGEWKVG